MIKKIINLIIISLPLLLEGQITVSVQLPPAGMVQKDQLWNLILVNNSNRVYDLNMQLTLQDAVTGQTVLTGVTRNIVLGNGVRTIGVRDVQPVQYNYIINGFDGNFLPLGSYIACYRISRYTNEKNETVSDECVRININPLSPPLLNTPLNRSTVFSVYPQLTWTPPTPIDMFDNLNYQISVAEILEGQSPSEAILYNTPIYTRDYIKVPYEIYPSSSPKLEKGKAYAWQVTAKNNINYAASTEVWTFQIGADSVKTEVSDGNYILLKKNSAQSGINYVSDNNLLVKYYSYDRQHETIIRFMNRDGKVIQSLKQKIIYGDNFLRFQLNKKFQSQEIYFIEIADLQNEKLTATFSIK